MEAFYTPKRPGTYRIQCWGAQGGGSGSYPGGRGAYTKGDLTLTQDENLYVCVGQNGSANGIIFNNGSERTNVGNAAIILVVELQILGWRQGVPGKILPH